MPNVPVPRLVRPVLDPLALYFRAGYNDHRELSSALASGRRRFTGVVVEANRVERHREMLDLAERSKLECVLDPCTQAAATPGGFSESLGNLPWGSGRRQRYSDFEGEALIEKMDQIAEFAVEQRFSQIIAPTHFISKPNDPWLSIDIGATHLLRTRLDQKGARKVGLIYSLTIPYALLRNETARVQIVDKLDGIPADALWIRVDPFGSDSTGAAVRNYLEASSEFHRLGIPMVADQVGGLVGLALLSTSAVGGLSHGVTLRERFSMESWKRVSPDGGFAMPCRVYFETLDLFLKPADARQLFDGSTRLAGHFGCSDLNCCPRGVKDMVENPAIHFLGQRMKQVEALSQIPESLRANEFLARYVRPTADEVVRFASSQALDEALRERMARHRKRLDLFRVSLEDIVRSSQARSASAIPDTRAAREHRPPR